MTSWRESTGKYIPIRDYQRYAHSLSRAISRHLFTNVKGTPMAPK